MGLKPAISKAKAKASDLRGQEQGAKAKATK